MIYLDSNATSSLAPEALEAMLPYLTHAFANPSSSYASGRRARAALAEARQQVASLLGARSTEVIFTSGGTESNNTAIESARRLYWPERQHLILAATEHSAVLEPAQRWERLGGSVTRLACDSEGRLSLAHLEAVLSQQPTALVSLMWANNETGVLAQIAEITELAHHYGALVHTDAVQAIGKVPVNVVTVPVDYLSLSGHKFHAPQGVGALFVSQRIRFEPLLLGGGQESGRRSGTENVASLVALGTAAALAASQLRDGTVQRMAQLRDLLEKLLLEGWPDLQINGHPTHRLPTTSSVTFPGLSAAEFLLLLDAAGLCCSAGSACHTASVHPSHVLEAMGKSAAHAASTLRFSVCRYTTEQEIHTAAERILAVARKLLELKGDPSSFVVSQ